MAAAASAFTSGQLLRGTLDEDGHLVLEGSDPSSHGADLGRTLCWIQLKEHLDSFLTQASLHVRPLWLSCGAPDQRSYSTKDLILADRYSLRMATDYWKYLPIVYQ